MPFNIAGGMPNQIEAVGVGMGQDQRTPPLILGSLLTQTLLPARYYISGELFALGDSTHLEHEGSVGRCTRYRVDSPASSQAPNNGL